MEDPLINSLFKWVGFLLLITIIQHPCSARVLDEQSPPSQVIHQPITFFMQDILSSSHHLSIPHTTQINGQIPIAKPIDHVPPTIVNPQPKPINPTKPFIPVPGQNTFDPSVIELSFPTIATLQGLELGTITTINEELIEGNHPLLGSSILLGKAKGVYVQSSDEGHMMAMNVIFSKGGFKDSLKFFGVHRSDLSESHIAVIGGTGKFHGANGYAAVKDVTVGLNVDDEFKTSTYSTVKKFLQFTIYLGY